MLKNIRITAIFFLCALLLCGSLVTAFADPSEAEILNPVTETSSAATSSESESTPTSSEVSSTPSSSPSSTPSSSASSGSTSSAVSASVTYTILYGSTDLTDNFTKDGSQITGTVPFDVTSLSIQLSDGSTQKTEPCQLTKVGENSFNVSLNTSSGRVTYQFIITREEPEFSFKITDASSGKNLTSHFQMTADGQLAGTVSNSVSSVKVEIFRKGESTVLSKKQLELKVGENTDTLNPKISGTEYPIKVIVNRAQPDGFTVMHGDKDISALFKMSNNKLTGTVDSDVESVVVSIRQDGYSDNGGIEYQLEPGQNRYTHEILAGNGKILFQLVITRDNSSTSSSSSSSSSATSSATSSQETSSQPETSSQEESKPEDTSSVAPSVPEEPTPSAPSSEPEVPSSAPESQPDDSEKKGGKFSALLLVAILLILLGLLGIVFVVLDTLYTYGILKKWIFHAPKATPKSASHAKTPTSTTASSATAPIILPLDLDSTETPVENSKETEPKAESATPFVPTKPETPVVEQPQTPTVTESKPKTESKKILDEDWDDFFRNN